jgi:hypothetical protein
VRGCVKNNIKPLMWLYPKSLSFWDNKLFNMVSEPLDPLDYPLFGQSVIVESAGESREARGTFLINLTFFPYITDVRLNPHVTLESQQSSPLV